MASTRSPLNSPRKHQAAHEDNPFAALMASSEETTGHILVSDEYVSAFSLYNASAVNISSIEEIKVFLMHKDGRYMPYQMQVIGADLAFTSLTNSTTQQYHALDTIHVHTIDGREEKNTDDQNNYYGIVLSFSNMTCRKVFF